MITRTNIIDNHRRTSMLATVTLAPKAPIAFIVQRQHSISLAIGSADAVAHSEWLETSAGKPAPNKPVLARGNLLSP